MFMLRFLFTAALAVLLAAPLSAQQSLFTTQTPQVQVDTDNAAGEYGMIFTSSAAGHITALRFWKSSSDTGAHTGRLWRVSDRALLAVVTFTNANNATGWQTQSLSAPVPIAAGTQYLVTVSTPRYYGYTNNGLRNVITNGSLSSVVGNNGLYGFTLGAFPTLTYQRSNYFRDVVFVSGPLPAIDVTPNSATLIFGATQQFAAALSGGASGPVNWSATCGAITSSGLYTAPASGSSCNVTGAVTGATDTSTVTLSPPPSIDVTPNTITMPFDATQQFAAALSGGAAGPVNWSATCGSIDSSGLYTAPASGSSCNVTGSVTGASDTSTVTLAASLPPTIDVVPNSITLSFGATQQFSAALGGSAVGPVNWSATCGAINSSGLYTAPAGGSSCDVTGAVTGAADTSAVTLSAPTIDVTPNTVSLNFGQQQQFSAALGGGASGPVTWSATCGAINSSGLYTAPASGSSCDVTGQASGATDTSIVSLPQAATTSYYHDFRDPEWFINNRTADTTNNEIACYRPEQVSMTNGLVITAIYQTNTCSSGISPSQQWPYTSGQIMWNSRGFLYGTVEFRAKFPTGQGTWPSVWLHGVVCQEYFKNWDGTCGWPTPPADEIDVAEVMSINPGTVNQQIHSGSHSDGCRPTVNLSQYHTYQFIWQPGSLTWKIDGNTTCTVTGSYVPSNPMFLIVNVAVGGIGGGTPDPGVFPQSLFLDYIKITP